MNVDTKYKPLALQGAIYKLSKPGILVFFLITECISFIKDSPFSQCKFPLKGLNYATCTQTKHAWPGFQYSLAVLHQLSIWPSAFPKPR